MIATSIPGTEVGVLDEEGKRFAGSQRIEGTLPEMLEGSIAFVRKNMRVSTKIDTATGRRIDVPQYPMDAVREAILNALVHRDYSIHTEGLLEFCRTPRSREEICNYLAISSKQYAFNRYVTHLMTLYVHIKTRFCSNSQAK